LSVVFLRVDVVDRGVDLLDAVVDQIELVFADRDQIRVYDRGCTTAIEISDDLLDLGVEKRFAAGDTRAVAEPVLAGFVDRSDRVEVDVLGFEVRVFLHLLGIVAVTTPEVTLWSHLKQW
jgi:hypothetical protein